MASMPENFLPDNSARAARRERVSVAGQAYYLTVTTLFRRPVFRDVDAARAVSALHGHPPVWGRSRCLAWVLMPDHWHGLIELGPIDTLSTLIGRIKGATANAINAQRKTRGGVWSDGFHDHAIRRDQDVVSVARYIVLNPVRAGLVQRVGEYPFWDAIWLDEEHRG